MSNTQKVKCACADCTCMISEEKAIHHGGKSYCCQDCADHHAHKAGCDHAGCNCHG